MTKPPVAAVADPFAEPLARLAAIVAGADDAIVSKTLEGIITSWNPAAEKMFGWTAAEAIGQSIALIIPPERMHEEAQILARLQRGQKTEHFETERLHKNGRHVIVSVNVSPVRDATGRVIGASKIARDVTEQRQAQQKIEAGVRSLEALYRLADLVGQARTERDVCEAAVGAIVSSLRTERASVLVFDASGVMRFVAWRGLSEHYRLCMEGHSPWQRDSLDPQPILVEDVLADPRMAALREEITREGIRSLAFIPLLFQHRLLGKFMVYFDQPRTLHPDEQRLAETIGRHVAFGLARVDAENKAAAALARERTARSEADAARSEAERASQTKDEFLAMLAHELRNPLGAIVHAVKVLDQVADQPADAVRASSMIDRQSSHLARLLDDLLDVARITSGRIELRSEPLDLRAVIGLAVDAQRVGVRAKEQHLTVSLPPAEVMVTGDPVRLQQVVGNLVHNASKYSPKGGSIRIEARQEGDQAVLRVSDDGEGIATDRLESIFELFVQGNPTLARTEGGLGIGLTLVQRVIELHRGQVVARSAGAGQGAAFEVRLPATRAVLRCLPPAENAPRPSARRILVVEDHDDGREALAMLLRLQGHEVSEAAGGRQALDLAQAQGPEVVLLDIGLPDLDGYEVARNLRASLGPEVRLIALTGYGQPMDRERAMRAGFDAHLLKPVDLEKINETLATLPADAST